MSKPSDLAQDLEAACRALVRVQQSNLGLEIQLPVIYPNGDFVTVVVAKRDDQFWIHDAGFAAMTLANHAVKLTPKMRARIQSLSKHYGCDFSSDRMSRIAPFDELPLAVAVVANASRTIADQILETHQQPIFSFRQEVVDRVRDLMGAKRVRENESVLGNSGTEYSIGAAVLDVSLSAPVAYIEAVHDRDGVNKKFREFYDISLVPALNTRDRILAFDERANLRQGDLIVLQDVCNVVRFTDVEARLKQYANAE